MHRASSFVRRWPGWRTLLALAGLAALLACPTAHAADACNGGKPIRFAGITWESGTFITNVLRQILEAGYGCRTEEVPGNTAATETALSQDDLQVWAEQWTGRSEIIAKAVEAGTVKLEGDMLPGGVRQGWYVPEYVIKGDPARGIAPMAPDLRSWRDLPRYKALFADDEEPGKGRFLNCPSGWDCERVDTRLMKLLKLDADYTNFRPGTGAAMDAAIASAYEQGKPVLFYYWEPAALLARYKFVQLELPAFNARCWQTLATHAESSPCASGFLVSQLKVGVSTPFAQHNPELIALFGKVSFPMELLNQTIYDMTRERTDGAAMATRFLHEHPEIWRAWLAPDVAARVSDKLGLQAHTQASMFPQWSVVSAVNDRVSAMVRDYGGTFRRFSQALLQSVLLPLENLLRAAPPWLLLGLIGLVAWNATRRPAAAVLVVAALYLIGALGLWDKLMQTLALVLVATLYSIVIGVPVGIWMSRSNTLRRLLMPVLDVMQTLPSFVYLVPVLMLFGLGKVPAIFATVVYAVPPLIRLTDLGIRHVDAETVEAARAFGATRWQMLLGVQLPLARPSIMAGINQTTMMALSMVVLASMIGARGLGEDVLAGIQTLDVGRGLQAGVAIVILAIVIDRISQSYGLPRRLRARRTPGATA